MIGMHPLFRKWFMIFLAVVMFGVVCCAAAVGALLGYVHSMPPLESLHNYNPPEVTKIYDRTGNKLIAQWYPEERRELISYKDIPEHVVNAFIAIEDERFHQHFGIDLEGWGRVFKLMAQGGRVQGASTITMQVARNIILNDRTRSVTRKFKELLLALQIERQFSKEQIIEFYLNHIFLGGPAPGAYGIQAASKAYFNKDVKDLTIPEAALLAGMPKAPSQLSPFRNRENALLRRNAVLGNMRKCGFIKTDEELKRYQATPIVLNPAPRIKPEAEYYVDYVRAKLMEEEGAENRQDLGQKAYSIISNVDLELQKICEEELSKALREVEKEIQRQKPERFAAEANKLGRAPGRKQARLAYIREVKDGSIIVNLEGYTGEVKLPPKLPYFNPGEVVKPGKLIDIWIEDIQPAKRKLVAYLYDKSHVQGAAVLLDNKTGEILAMVGGDDYNDPVNDGQWNRAWQGGRQPGSCWKPLLYGAAFDLRDEKGRPRFTPGTVIIDEPFSVGNWTPKNYTKRHYGAVTLHEALVNSLNIPTVKLFMEIGRKKAVELYRKYNVVNGPEGWKLTSDPPMCLGTPNVTALELAAAYAVFANQGVGITPRPIKRVFSTKSPGDSRTFEPKTYRVLSPEAAYATTRILQDVVARGTAKTTVGKWYMEQVAKGRKLPEIAAKTGTTNDCFVAWLVGYTPDLTLAIYVGYDQHRSMGPTMVGGRTVGPIWVAMMDRILQTRNDWKMKFDPPAEMEFRDVCSKSGQLVTPACYASGAHVFKNAAFKKGTEPTTPCSYHGSGGYSEDGSPSEAEMADPERFHDPSAVDDYGQPYGYQQPVYYQNYQYGVQQGYW